MQRIRLLRALGARLAVSFGTESGSSEPKSQLCETERGSSNDLI
jgi:hypothetical protein